jgi:hypothetical protein
MKKIYFIGALLATSMSFGQISISALNTPHNENFDGMGPAGTALPANWSAVRGGGTGVPAGANLVMQVTEGSANTGTIYNVGAASATDRALGSISSNSTFPAFGVNFINNTGDQIKEITISALVKQWRSGSADTFNEVMAFSYSTNATSLNDGTWTAVTSLNVNEILTTTTAAAAVDGNAPANQSNISAVINLSAAPIAIGSTIWIKWLDDNAVGNDSLLAIDNLSVSATEGVLSTSENNISGLKVYPNPAKNVLNITSDSNEVKQVEVYNVLGKLVLSTKATNAPVNISSLASGVYVVKVTEEGKTASRRLVIE